MDSGDLGVASWGTVWRELVRRRPRTLPRRPRRFVGVEGTLEGIPPLVWGWGSTVTCFVVLASGAAAAAGTPGSRPPFMAATLRLAISIARSMSDWLGIMGVLATLEVLVPLVRPCRTSSSESSRSLESSWSRLRGIPRTGVKLAGACLG